MSPRASDTFLSSSWKILWGSVEQSVKSEELLRQFHLAFTSLFCHALFDLRWQPPFSWSVFLFNTFQINLNIVLPTITWCDISWLFFLKKNLMILSRTGYILVLLPFARESAAYCVGANVVINIRFLKWCYVDSMNLRKRLHFLKFFSL